MNDDSDKNIQKKQPAGFRSLGAEERKSLWESGFFMDDDERSAGSASPAAFELADLMVETAVGIMPIPLGIAGGFLIDGVGYSVPLAVEEPSVIAAAGYAAHIIAKGGGFSTWAGENIMQSYIYLRGVDESGEKRLADSEPALRGRLFPTLESLEKRGGGLRSFRLYRLPKTRLIALELSIDVRDAMGANIVNTAAEALRPLAEELSGGDALMCILSNASLDRKAGARFSLPFSILQAASKKYGGREAAERIVLACDLANEDARRAVTHNKGIMNGIASLALATMNDTRAIEAGAHAYAARNGAISSLSAFSCGTECLEGSLELPLAFATVGGSVDLHPSARACLRLMGNPDSARLARIAAAVGLAQNFAALLALVTGGIQGGHMKLHAARLAYKAGARGSATRAVADELSRKGIFTLRAAQLALLALRQRPADEAKA